MRLQAVIGGEGPPLLLVHGWPEKLVPVAQGDAGAGPGLRVIAVDQRGIGRSDKPRGGYDTGTLAGELVALMDALGHGRFAVVGHDTGHFISYALAADHPHRVDRVALLEVPRPPGGKSLTAPVPPGADQQQALDIPSSGDLRDPPSVDRAVRGVATVITTVTAMARALAGERLDLRAVDGRGTLTLGRGRRTRRSATVRVRLIRRAERSGRSRNQAT